MAKPEGKRSLGRQRLQWVYNIKMDLGERKGYSEAELFFSYTDFPRIDVKDRYVSIQLYL
jgi:hypothetical protein